MIDFVGFNKISRLNRDIIITEKIDGTNAQIRIVKHCEVPELSPFNLLSAEMTFELGYQILAGSRNRWLTLDNDNFGFAKFVSDNKYSFIDFLGAGTYFGEWWGQGIQRGYDMKKKRFSMFNTERFHEYGEAEKITIPSNPKEAIKYSIELPPNISLVPVLYNGIFDQKEINSQLERLEFYSGSVCSQGFMRPEGIVIFHKASGSLFKITIENDGVPKSKV